MIRPAEMKDLKDIILLGFDMHRESCFRTQKYSTDKVAESFVNWIKDDDSLVLVVEEAGEIVGGMAAFISAPWFSNVKSAHDISVFIRKDKRGSMIAPKLINAYKQWAEMKGVVLENICLGITTGVEIEKTCKFYEHIGAKQVGMSFRFGDQLNV